MERKSILLIPEKTDPEFETLFEAWTASGGSLKRLGKYWIKEEALTQVPIAIYGNQTFALVLAQIYEVILLSPDDLLMARIGNGWVKRNIQVISKKEAASAHVPCLYQIGNSQIIYSRGIP